MLRKGINDNMKNDIDKQLKKSLHFEVLLGTTGYVVVPAFIFTAVYIMTKAGFFGKSVPDDGEAFIYLLSSILNVYGIIIGVSIALVAIVYALPISNKIIILLPRKKYQKTVALMFAITIISLFAIVGIMLTGASIPKGASEIDVEDITLNLTLFICTGIMFVRLLWTTIYMLYSSTFAFPKPDEV